MRRKYKSSKKVLGRYVCRQIHKVRTLVINAKIDVKIHETSYLDIVWLALFLDIVAPTTE